MKTTLAFTATFLFQYAFASSMVQASTPTTENEDQTTALTEEWRKRLVHKDHDDAEVFSPQYQSSDDSFPSFNREQSFFVPDDDDDATVDPWSAYVDMITNALLLEESSSNNSKNDK